MGGTESSHNVLDAPPTAAERVESSDTESSEALARQPVEGEEEEEVGEEKEEYGPGGEDDGGGGGGGESVQSGSLMQMYVEEACRKAKELREKSEGAPQ